MASFHAFQFEETQIPQIQVLYTYITIYNPISHSNTLCYNTCTICHIISHTKQTLAPNAIVITAVSYEVNLGKGLTVSIQYIDQPRFTNVLLFCNISTIVFINQIAIMYVHIVYCPLNLPLGYGVAIASGHR